ncbi:unnamed protein product [Sphagnum balticum]
MSIYFFDDTFDPYIGYGNTRASILTKLQSKVYRGGGTYTGSAINQTINKIVAANYANGVPKILVILTDGISYDDVVGASNYAKANGVVLFCVGIGSGANLVQLQLITGTSSNIIMIQAYSSLITLVGLIENYFCKQILDVNLNQTIYGNQVRVSASPSYFRVVKAPLGGQYYQLVISYETDPSTAA